MPDNRDEIPTPEAAYNHYHMRVIAAEIFQQIFSESIRCVSSVMDPTMLHLPRNLTWNGLLLEMCVSVELILLKQPLHSKHAFWIMVVPVAFSLVIMFSELRRISVGDDHLVFSRGSQGITWEKQYSRGKSGTNSWHLPLKIRPSAGNGQGIL